MSDRWESKNLNNLGLFKKKLIDINKTVIDKRSMHKIFNEIEAVTDTLFIPLNIGVRYPSIMSCSIKYGIVSNEWEIDVTKPNTIDFVTSITSSLDGGILDYIDVVLNYSSTFSKTDTTPLFFIKNTSDVSTYYLNQKPFPRYQQFITDNTSECTCRFVIETLKDSTYNKMEFEGNKGIDGMSFSVEALFQTTQESVDYNFFTTTEPYFYQYSNFVGRQSFRVDTLPYADYEDSTVSQVAIKCSVRLKAVPWVGDCTSGSQDSGDTVISSWGSYVKGNRWTDVLGLDNLQQYKVYGQIDALVGKDLMDWYTLGCYTTVSSGGGYVDPA